MKEAKLITPVLLFLFCVVVLFTSIHAQDVQVRPQGEQIAFLRNGDVWLMKPDGSNQQPWVAGIANCKGRLSWSPDNKRVVFSRQGRVDIKYPEGGGGYHFLYDLFYAYIDSIGVRNNFWYGFTQTLGAQSPSWSADGSMISFTYDLSGNQVDATFPSYTIGLFKTDTEEITMINLPQDKRQLMALSTSMSPDGSKVGFILAELKNANMNRLGLVVLPASPEINKTTEELVEMASINPDATSPSWSPDGSKILILKSDGIYYVNSDLYGETLIAKPEEGLWVSGTASWSPDGKKIAFGTSNGAIYTVNIDGTGLTRISGPGNDFNPAWTK